jgi:hypothetical protein
LLQGRQGKSRAQLLATMAYKANSWKKNDVDRWLAGHVVQGDIRCICIRSGSKTRLCSSSCARAPNGQTFVAASSTATPTRTWR